MTCYAHSMSGSFGIVEVNDNPTVSDCLVALIGAGMIQDTKANRERYDGGTCIKNGYIRADIWHLGTRESRFVWTFVKVGD